jgi:hypothetical protein
VLVLVLVVPKEDCAWLAEEAWFTEAEWFTDELGAHAHAQEGAVVEE